jgi:hypothetical protein
MHSSGRYRKAEDKSETQFRICPLLYGAQARTAQRRPSLLFSSRSLAEARVAAGARGRRQPRAHFPNKSFKGTRVSLVRCTGVIGRAP